MWAEEIVQRQLFDLIKFTDDSDEQSTFDEMRHDRLSSRWSQKYH